ncbi:Hfi1p NDAI_0F01170 [Naumovozyma dairenensis CBS 421]|uniref:Transcriptional coactivator HFI1/ADA1 n=1 Tax=Naumovozyma dairenensis (strain ATCC 10597 / BCRC 20456 / CBS 421 / NBRC 0211 / NRRL Y-12639) TaxID=1071378 RepID=G0WCC5_NAUDC|nr:hypothetical protein NDAI_0F01170 [Naumovozyma dairenensis CBS 421]CCD25436.1 hypothetical protein NDAI_0F01170 [Naumovozyma dairenensis CBS 421]
MSTTLSQEQKPMTPNYVNSNMSQQQTPHSSGVTVGGGGAVSMMTPSSFQNSLGTQQHGHTDDADEHSDPDEKNLIPSVNKRLDLSPMIEKFTSILGRPNWIKYAQLLSLFILGKLSRKELSRELEFIFNSVGIHNVSSSSNKKLHIDIATIAGDTLSLKRQRKRLHNKRILTRLHNQLLLGVLTNSLKDSPLSKKGSRFGFQNASSSSSSSSGTNVGISASTNKNMKRSNKTSSQIEIYKKIVLSLPIADRNRLKLITKDAGKQGFIYCSVLQSRLNIVPKIPIVSEPETLKRIKSNNLKTPLEWSQDIMNGFNTPLCTDNYSLPDVDSLYLKMTGISREHGLVGNVDTRCIDILMMGLDHYLKNIIEFTIDSVRYRKKKYSDYYDLDDDIGFYKPVTGAETIGDDSSSDNKKQDRDDENAKDIISLTNEDLYNTLNIFPNLIESTTSAYYNLTNLGLLNDDELVVGKSSIEDLPEFQLNEKPTFTPIDEKNIGTREELNWLIKDILTNE